MQIRGMRSVILIGWKSHHQSQKSFTDLSELLQTHSQILGKDPWILPVWFRILFCITVNTWFDSMSSHAWYIHVCLSCKSVVIHEIIVQLIWVDLCRPLLYSWLQVVFLFYQKLWKVSSTAFLFVLQKQLV